MADICRLCLCVSPASMYTLTKGCDILHKIQSCLSVHIDIYEDLPDKLCLNCTNKVDDIFEYQQKTMQNNTMLLSHYNDGIDSLKKFYFELHTQSDIYRYKKNCIHSVKIEATNTAIKQEIEDDNLDEVFNSEDEINLSVLKKEKKVESEIVKNVARNELKNAKQVLKNKKNAKKVIKQKHVKKKKSSKRSGIPYSISFVKEEELNDNNDKPLTVGIETFKCVQCFAMVATYNELLNHYNNEHRINKDEDIENDSDRFYVQSEDGHVTFKCKKCDKAYDEKRGITRHILKHIEESPFLCKLCGRTYKTAYDIARHGKVHNGFKLTCKYKCGYSTPYAGAIREHEMRHRREFKYKCVECGKGFHVKTWFDQHKNIHTGLKPFVCDICNVAFHMERYLTNHRSVVHDIVSSGKRYSCTLCPEFLESRKSRTAHIVEVHGVKSNFLCDICGKVFSDSGRLKQHSIIVHDGIKPYTCDICKRSFAKKYTLTEHMRTHTGDKRASKRCTVACVKCGKQYNHKSTLYRHYSVHHSGPGSQKCAKCQVTFATVRTLKSHQKLCYKT